MQKFLCRLIIMMCALLFGVAHACDTNQIDILDDGTNCIDTKFSLTTTSLTLPDESEFRWYMSASGTFYVDCGTDGTLSGTGVSGKTITRTTTDEELYTCTYTSGGTKTISMAGLATGYNKETAVSPGGAAIRFGYDTVADNSTPTLIIMISGSIGRIFPTLGQTNGQQPRFKHTFGVTNITAIPEHIFDGIYGGISLMFYATFYRCYNLTDIPEKLFINITSAPYIFRSTFNQCTKLTSIPENLFNNITAGANYMFQYTFKECRALTKIPNYLFSNISTHATGLFQNTFASCSNLSGYIPSTLFAGLINNGSQYAGGMFNNSFYHTNLTTTCPTGTTQYITGYENYWDNHVSCTPNVITINWNDGNGGTDTTTCTYGGTITTPTVAPTKRGHTFLGWRFVAPSGN